MLPTGFLTGAVLRWVYRIFGLLLVILVVAVAAFFLIPAERIARVAADRFEAETGRALTVEGPVKPTLSPLGVSTGPVSLANADWSDGTPMLSAQSMKVGVNLAALLKGSVKVETLDIVVPKILLETNAAGEGNWELGGPVEAGAETTAEEPGSPLPEISIDRAQVAGGTLTWRDGVAGTEFSISAISADIALPAISGALDITVSGVYEGLPVSVDGRIGEFANFLTRGATPVELLLKVAGAEAKLNGRAGLVPLAADLHVSAKPGPTDALLAAFGLAPLGLPAGLGREVALDGQVVFAENRVALRDATLLLDENRITGAADISLDGPKPVVMADLNLGTFDLSALGGGEAGEAAPAEDAASGWPTDPIDASALGLFDGKIAISADAIDLGSLRLGETWAVTEIANARAVTDIRKLAAYDGAITGKIVVNARNGLSARTNLKLREVAVQGLLTDLATYERLTAPVDADLKLLMSGGSVAAMMQSLEGTGGFRLGKGELIGLDLLGMLRTLSTDFVGEGAKTIFDEISATFVIDKGVLLNDDLLLRAPLFDADGAGRIGIGDQTLDYRLTAGLSGAEDGFRVPVTLTGPWASPRIRPDFEGIAGDRLREEVDKLEDRARDEVRERVTEELGIEIGEDEKVEDVLRRELEERGLEGLGGFLGR